MPAVLYPLQAGHQAGDSAGLATKPGRSMQVKRVGGRHRQWIVAVKQQVGGAAGEVSGGTSPNLDPEAKAMFPLPSAPCNLHLDFF